MSLRFGVWMALAKATPLRAENVDVQGILAPCDDALIDTAAAQGSSAPD
jgi:hypothetical protein